MPSWSPHYKIRRSTRILSFAVRQLQGALNVMGEGCYLLKRMSRANAPTVQREGRRVSTLTKTASSYTIDPDTGMYRYKLWGRDSDSVDEYPDIYVSTITVQGSASTDIWEPAVDKYTFISGQNEIAWDIFQDQVLEDGTAVEDAVYVVFNTPPMMSYYQTTFTFGIINPLVKFEGLQPVRDTEDQFKTSLFGFEQWLNSSAVRPTS